ncbi:MAG: hypothetical protein IKD76_02255, partial [Clostridia bacterium]|nr:hypothetical protein [Clostridia bacterium]
NFLINDNYENKRSSEENKKTNLEERVNIEGIEKQIVTKLKYGNRNYIITSYANNHKNVIEVYSDDLGKYIATDASDKINQIVLKILKQKEENENSRDF